MPCLYEVKPFISRRRVFITIHVMANLKHSINTLKGKKTKIIQLQEWLLLTQAQILITDVSE